MQAAWSSTSALIPHAHAPEALYQERWAAEASLPSSRSINAAPASVLTSRPPEGVLRQIRTHLLVHHALRELMVRTAAIFSRGLDADRISFTEP